MFNSVEYVRSVCKQRNIPISKLEKDCGCGNGYLNPKKLKFIPYERAVIIADYLGLSTEFLMTGKSEKTPPTPEGEGLDTLDMEALNLLRQLRPENQKQVFDFAQALLKIQESAGGQSQKDF